MENRAHDSSKDLINVNNIPNKGFEGSRIEIAMIKTEEYVLLQICMTLEIKRMFYITERIPISL